MLDRIEPFYLSPDRMDEYFGRAKLTWHVTTPSDIRKEPYREFHLQAMVRAGVVMEYVRR